MDLQKHFNRMCLGITGSPSKKKVLIDRLYSFEAALKKHWYKKLLVKLCNIKDGEMSLDDYINNIKEKVK